MKVYMSNYRNHWLSPYHILEKFFFWRKDYDAYDKEPPKWLQDMMRGINTLLDTIHPRIEHVKIDNYDVWNFPETLGLIVLPMLKEIRKQKHGSPFVDDELVPDYLKSMNAQRVENEWDVDDNFHKRFEWALDEMIWSFSQLNTDWEAQYRTGVSDIQWIKLDGGTSQMVDGPNHTMKTDFDGMKRHQARMQHGFKLFGILYQSLWT